MSSTKKKPSYEDKAIHLANQFIGQVCENTPELRSVTVLFDWEDKFAEISLPAIMGAAADSGLSLDQPELLLGMLRQTLKLLQTQNQYAVTHLQKVQQSINQQREILVHESTLSEEEKTTLLSGLLEASRQVRVAEKSEEQESTSTPTAGGSPEPRRPARPSENS